MALSEAGRSQAPALAVVIGLTCLASCGSLVYPPLAPYIVADLGIGYAAVGVLSSMIYLGAAAGSVAAGGLVDRIGVVAALVTSLGVLGAALALSAALSSYAALVAAALVAGLGFALLNPAANAAVGSGFTRAARGTVMGVKQTGIAAGGILAGLWMPAAALAAGWRAGLAQLGAALIVAAGALAAFGRGTRLAVLRRDGERAERSTAPVPRTVSLWLGGFTLTGSQSLLQTYLAVYLTAETGATGTRAGAIFAVMQASALIGRVALGVASDRLLGGRRGPLLAGAALVAAAALTALALAGSADAPAALVAAVALAGSTAIGWNGVYMAALVDVAPPGAEGRTSGVGVAPNLLGVVLFPPLGGWMLDAGASFTEVWLASAAIAVLAAVLFWRFDER